MDKSKFQLTPDEIYDSFDRWDESGERYEKIATAAANHAIKTLVEQLVEDLEDKYELYLGMKEWGEDSLFHGYLMPAGFKQELLKLLGAE